MTLKERVKLLEKRMAALEKAQLLLNSLKGGEHTFSLEKGSHDHTSCIPKALLPE